MTSPARADDRLKQLGALKIPAPGPGIDTAKPMAPTWCAAMSAQGDASAMRQTLEAAEKDYTEFAAAAREACLSPNAPEVAHGTAVLLQNWMNLTGENEAQAAESLGLRANAAKFEADRGALCGGLTVSDEVAGEEKEYMEARSTLFGCVNDAPLWVRNAKVDILAVLDASVAEPDELVRTARVLSESHYIQNPKNDDFDKQLVKYAFDQIDFHAVSEAEMLKLLGQAPYAKNTYARAVGLESAAMARNSVALIQHEVDSHTAKDPDWKTLLITAPQKAIADWTSLATKYKDQLARSTAYEKVYWGPSAKASQGCFATLSKDFIGVLKDLKHANENELNESLNNPVAAVLFNRLVACASRDMDPTYAMSLIEAAGKVRWARGPRLAAYYGAIEALGPIRSDRTKFSVTNEDLRVFGRDELIAEAEKVGWQKQSTYDTMGWAGDGGEGIVKAVSKHAKGILVTFVTSKVQAMNQSCTDTNRILMFGADGPIYYRNCKNTGLVAIDTTPESITLPVAEWAEGIKPGALLKFRATRGTSADRLGMPLIAYSDKSKKKLVNWMGFGL